MMSVRVLALHIADANTGGRDPGQQFLEARLWHGTFLKPVILWTMADDSTFGGEQGKGFMKAHRATPIATRPWRGRMSI